MVNEFLQTSFKDVFAAGDVVETQDLARGEYRVNSLWPCAVEQGRIAAQNMTGNPQPYHGSLSMNALEFFQVSVISMGIVATNSSEYREENCYQPDKNIYKKIVFKDNRVVGMVFVNHIDNAGLIGTLIRKKVDVASVEDRLLQDDFTFAHLLPLVHDQKDKFPEPEFRFVTGTTS